MKPKVYINIEGVKKNTLNLVTKAHQYGISVAGITKGCCGNEAFAKAQIEAGIDFLGDSRIENLEKLQHLTIDKILLRSPKLSEIEKVISYTQYSLNTNLKVIQALSRVAVKKNVNHSIILMVDIGDLREGIWHENLNDIYNVVELIISLNGITLAGVGTNFTCFGGIMPTEENYKLLIKVADKIRKRFNISLPIVSGGNSSSLQMLYEGKIPKGITHLRVNQSIYTGIEIGEGNQISNWETEIVSLQAEIIEIQVKPSYPQGTFAIMNAFGPIKNFKDKGMRKRAIVALGRQDMNIEGLKPVDSTITVEGASSDHLILDITDSNVNYSIGHMVEFNVTTYASIITAMASPFIEKVANI
ncbi:alanine/ornithine racemase family PLP-dependent enzyme [Lysinibacillus xylanilyticus]|uniref:alanine/ornithine racemase family PLP-dependent enzyme n=1 Tax=Lysinibacillus xylanilyticus TaxID=582475 RepID=UPI0038197BE7